MNRKKPNRLSSKNNTAGNFTLNNTVFYVLVIAWQMFIGISPIYAVDRRFNTTNTDHDQLFDLMPVGEGKYTWFGLSIYEASLWTSTGTFKDLESSYPIALILRYQINIESDALAEQTVSEWERLNIFDNDTRTYWGNKLAKIWPDIKPSESIITLVTGDKKTRFYHNDSLLAQLDDPNFGTALLSIWLNANTSEPGLRAKLIGQEEQ